MADGAPLSNKVDSAHALAPVPPVAAARRAEVHADGTESDQLWTADGHVYQFVRTVANALMGKVKLAVVCEPTDDGGFIIPSVHTMVAVKQLYKLCVERGVTTEGQPVKENPLAEVAMMAYLSDPGHENVMRLVHFLHDERCYYIVYEYLDGGELFDQVSLHSRVPEAEAKRYFTGTLAGMLYIHDKLVTHRDMSLENAMLTSVPEPGTVKIIDFGLALMMPPAALLPHDGRVGKAKYMAPEIYSGQAYDGRKIDIWCLGMMLFVLLFGVYPYQQASSKHCRYFREIENGRLLPMLESWGLAKLASAEALDLINRMLNVVPEHRITGQEILMHPWLVGGIPSSGAGAASVSVEDEVMR